MRSILFLVMLLTPAAASKLEYLDLLDAEVLGGARSYDVTLDHHFAGVTRSGGTLVSGGFGLRLVAREPSGNSNGGVRISVEAGGQWGRILGSSFSTVSRGEL